VLLLSPDFPDGQVETLPGHSVDSRDGVQWFSGLGAKLIQADALAVEGDRRLSDMREREASPDLTPKYRSALRGDLEHLEAALPTLWADGQLRKNELWGVHHERGNEAGHE
jgi:hypothetical protein